MLRSGGNYQSHREKTGLKCSGGSRTKQSFAKDADINVIVGRFMKTGVVPLVTMPPTHQSFENVFNFQDSMNLLVQAKNAFMQLPAELRSRFGNDPAAYVDFVSDEKNIDEMRKLGLANPRKDPEPEKIAKVRMVDGEGNDLVLRSDKIDAIKKIVGDLK